MAASRRTLVILYALHSWAGIITGLMLFVVCFSGSIVVFKSEIDLWANPSLKALPHVADPAGPDAVLASLHRRYPGYTPLGMMVPDDVAPVWFVFAKPVDGPRVKFAARPDSGEIVGPVDSELGQFFRMLHVFLFFGPRWIVGFLGVAMFFLIVSGFVIHRKIIKELFTVRWRRSLRLTASDLHKSVGVWALGFHLVIAFTGAWLGLSPVFERAYAYSSGKGQVAAVQSAPKPSMRQENFMPSVDALLARAQNDMPGLHVARIALRTTAGDTAVSFYGSLDGLLYSNASITYQGNRLKELSDPRRNGFWSRFNGLMEPLHFGDYGGLVLKWLYFLIGMSPALLSLSGTLLWMERRKLKKRSRSHAAVKETQHV